MDQQTFNLVLADKILFLPFKYNCIPTKLLGLEKNNFSTEKVNRLYETHFKTKQEMVDNAIVIHYATSGKPWKYTFVECGEEWYDCFKKSPYGKTKLKRKSKFEAHLGGVMRNIKEGGVKALVSRALWYIKNACGKTKFEHWG